jgi:hypothetical protein
VNLHASVIKHFGFFVFFNLKNLKKPEKTWKHQDLETYVPFTENLADLNATETYGTGKKN